MTRERRQRLLYGLTGWPASMIGHHEEDGDLFAGSMCCICFASPVYRRDQTAHLEGHIAKLTEEEILVFESLLAILPPDIGSTESAVQMLFGYDPRYSDSAIPFWASR